MDSLRSYVEKHRLALHFTSLHLHCLFYTRSWVYCFHPPLPLNPRSFTLTYSSVDRTFFNAPISFSHASTFP
jgi:hypothetical protein